MSEAPSGLLLFLVVVANLFVGLVWWCLVWRVAVVWDVVDVVRCNLFFLPCYLQWNEKGIIITDAPFFFNRDWIQSFNLNHSGRFRHTTYEYLLMLVHCITVCTIALYKTEMKIILISPFNRVVPFWLFPLGFIFSRLLIYQFHFCLYFIHSSWARCCCCCSCTTSFWHLTKVWKRNWRHIQVDLLVMNFYFKILCFLPFHWRNAPLRFINLLMKSLGAIFHPVVKVIYQLKLNLLAANL